MSNPIRDAADSIIVDQHAAAPRGESRAKEPSAEYRRALAGKSADELRDLLAQEWVDAEQRHVTDCHDCGLAYGGEGWIECIVPDDVWRAIGPTGDEGGILCITCIARRAKRAGLKSVPVMLCGTEAIRVADQDEAFQRGWNTAEKRIAELESTLARLTEERATASEPDAHHCHCSKVSACTIHTHPDPDVHAALNRLVEEVSRYDEATGSVSRLALASQRADGGTFMSVTETVYTPCPVPQQCAESAEITSWPNDDDDGN